MEDTLTALVHETDDGRIEVRAPSVGVWEAPPREGSVVRSGFSIGVLETLKVRRELVAPAGAAGVVVKVRDSDRTRTPVGYNDVLVVLDNSGSVVVEETAAKETRASASGGLVFASPMSGRFYGRPSPDKPPFVVAGDEVAEGQTICLLEVMKTFNRITYGGGDLPARAKVKAVRPADDDEVEAGDVILELESET